MFKNKNNGRVRILILASERNIGFREYPNLQIIIKDIKNYDQFVEYIGQQQRPFAIVIDLSQQTDQLLGYGDVLDGVFRKLNFQGEIRLPSDHGSNPLAWYNYNFELPALIIGTNRENYHEELDLILSYINGK